MLILTLRQYEAMGNPRYKWMLLVGKSSTFTPWIIGGYLFLFGWYIDVSHLSLSWEARSNSCIQVRKVILGVPSWMWVMYILIISHLQHVKNVYIYIHVYMYISLYIYIYIYIYVNNYIYTHIHRHIYTYIDIYIYIQLHLCIQVL